MRRTLTFSLLFLGTLPASGQTMLEQAKQRGAASAQNFDDDPVKALPKIPWVTQSQTVSSLGGDLGITRVESGDSSSKELGAGLFGQLHASKFDQPNLAGMWGQSWQLGLDVGFGADGTRYYGRGSVSANFGTMATLSAARHAFYLRFAAGAANFRDAKDGFSTGRVSIPLGFRFLVDSAALEFGAVPALGWSSVLHESRDYSTGPLTMGVAMKFETQAGYLELQRLLGVTPADAGETTLKACGHYARLVLCTEGTWLQLHDISRGDEARFARIGINIGFGNWSRTSERSERKWAMPDVEMRRSAP